MVDWFATVLIVLVIVLVAGAMFALAGVRGPWPSLVWFFVVLFLATLAIGVWADPIGPRWFGVPWVGLLVTTVFVGLLIAAVTPNSLDDSDEATETGEPELERPPADDQPLKSGSILPPRSRSKSRRNGKNVALAVGLFFWLFALLAIAIVLLRVFAV